MQQILEKFSKSPCSEDVDFAKSKVVAKRNRYKDKFPCELKQESYYVESPLFCSQHLPFYCLMQYRFHQLPAATIQLSKQ